MIGDRLKRKASARILPIAALNFLAYIGIGLPLAVLPIFVSHRLGYGAVLAGLTISLQYLATLLTRPLAGRMSDAVGPRRTVVVGLLACAASGTLLLVAGLAAATPVVAFVLLVANRFAMGLGESLVGTGNVTWNIGRVGEVHTGRILSWSGAAAYGAIALGAPLGAVVYELGGLPVVGGVVLAAALLGLAIASRHAAVAVVAGERVHSGPIFLAVLPYGAALAAGSIGFGTIAAFGSLYFAASHWSGASIALSLFGLAFVASRLLLGGMISRIGGFRMAIASLTVEAAGLLCLWLTTGPALALVGAALAGFGFGLVFPALGVEAVSSFPAASRGAAIGAYTVFLDISLGIAGPVAGWIAVRFGYPAIFLFAALSTLCGVGIVAWLRRRPQQAPRMPASRRVDFAGTHS